MMSMFNKVTLVISHIVIILLTTQVTRLTGQGQQSPCPDIFQYRYDGNEWSGYMEIQGPQIGQSIHLVLYLSLKARLSTKYVGAVELLGSRQAALQDFLSGRPIKYRIRFPLSYPLPRITSIVYNNNAICSGPPEFGGFITTITLEHTLYTEYASQSFGLSSNRRPLQQLPQQNNNDYFDMDNAINIISGGNNDGYYVIRPSGNTQNNIDNNRQGTIPQPPQNQINFQQRPPVQPVFQTQPPVQPNFQPQQQFRPPPLTTARPVIQETLPPEESNNDSLNSICGKPVRSPSPLVFGGEYITRGDWPWIVALFVKSLGNLNFHCGGTLISKKLVITAAHCIKDRDREPYKPSEVVSFLGRNNIIEWSDQGFTSSDITQIYMHPDYRAENLSYDSDLSILVLKSTISYTRFIRPICLWSFSANIRDIEQQVGIVVGWGRNENGSIVSAEAKKVNAPIVSEAECLRADESFRYITSNRTFCAGGLNGEGPCHGDSGGGLVLKYGDQWYLRGVVSVALSDPHTKSCNLNSYVVYTDVAQYDSWITRIMTENN